MVFLGFSFYKIQPLGNPNSKIIFCGYPYLSLADKLWFLRVNV